MKGEYVFHFHPDDHSGRIRKRLPRTQLRGEKDCSSSYTIIMTDKKSHKLNSLVMMN